MIPSNGYKKLEEYSVYEKEFDKFYQAHEKIVIFGTGQVSSIVTEYFNHRKLNIEFYCVTKRRTVPIPNIKELDEIKDEIDDSYGIVIAMAKNSADIAVEHLRACNVVEHVFHCPEFLYFCRLWKSRQSSEKVEFEDNSIKSISNYQLREDTFYIVCPAHIGETIYAASLVNAFKKQNNVDRVCLIVKQVHSDIPDFFNSVDEKLVSDEFIEVCEGFSMFTEVWKCRNYLYGCDIKNNPVLDQEFINKNIVSRYKSLMCDDERSELERIKSESFFPKGKQKSVILMPHAHSVPRLSNSFWERLASVLVERGYVVYTNIADETEYIIEGTQAVSKSLAEMPAFAERCSLTIALRSGLCDLLAFTKAKMIIINTDEICYKRWNLEDISDNIKNVLLNPQLDDEKNLSMLLRIVDLDGITV